MCKLTRLNYNPILFLWSGVLGNSESHILYSNVFLPLKHTHTHTHTPTPIPPHTHTPTHLHIHIPLPPPHTGFSDGTFFGAISENRRTDGECEELRMAIRVLDGKNCYSLLLALFPGLTTTVCRGSLGARSCHVPGGVI